MPAPVLALAWPVSSSLECATSVATMWRQGSHRARPLRLHTHEGWGFGLPIVYLAWFLLLATLYPACCWYAEVKRRRSDWWLSYL